MCAVSSTLPTRVHALGGNSQLRFCARLDARPSASLQLPRNRLLDWQSAPPIRFYRPPVFWFTASHHAVGKKPPPPTCGSFVTAGNSVERSQVPSGFCSAYRVALKLDSYGMTACAVFEKTLSTPEE